MSEDIENLSAAAYKALAFMDGNNVIAVMLFGEDPGTALLNTSAIIDVTGRSKEISGGWTYDQSLNEFSAPVQGL